MTHSEFAQGWKLLILQPWGWRYRSLTDQGQPTEESKTQLEFYYTKLKFGHREAWRHVAELYAQGKEWPSVNELRIALCHANTQTMKTLTAPTAEHEPMPPELRERFGKIGKAMP
jgi:hypothetical protein